MNIMCTYYVGMIAFLIFKDNEILANLYSNWNLEDVYMGQETDWDNDIPAKAAL